MNSEFRAFAIYFFLFCSVTLAPATVTGGGAGGNQPVFNSGNNPLVDTGTKSVIDVQADDGDGGGNDEGVTYSLVGGTDQSKFSIDSSDGQLSFKNKVGDSDDSDGNNDHHVDVQADDGTSTTTQSIVVNVVENDNPPSFSSGTTPSVNEGTTTAIDVDANNGDGGSNDVGVTYSINSFISDDDDKFSIDSDTGELTFDSPPNYENPTDDNSDNVYNVGIVADDGVTSVQQEIDVSITNLKPVFNSGNNPSVDEGTTGTAIDVQATDGDGGSPDTDITYSLGGTDESEFSIDSSTGQLSFDTAPDYENPADDDSDNEYIVDVQADDGSYTTTQAVTVTVNNINDEAPVFSSSNNPSVDEGTTATFIDVNATDGDGESTDTGITYSLSGTDESEISIDSSTGELSFDITPDYENPTDSDNDNEYVVDVQANDGSYTTTQTIDVTVNNQPPSISSYGVTNPSGQDVTVTFDSDEQLSTIEASVSGTESATLSTSDFNQTSNRGTYQYSASYTGSSDGSYTITLSTAEDSGGLDGATSQSDSTSVSTSSGGSGSGTDNSEPSTGDNQPNQSTDAEYSATADVSGYVTTVGSSLTFDAGESALPEDSSPTYEWDIHDNGFADVPVRLSVISSTRLDSIPFRLLCALTVGLGPTPSPSRWMTQIHLPHSLTRRQMWPMVQ